LETSGSRFTGGVLGSTLSVDYRTTGTVSTVTGPAKVNLYIVDPGWKNYFVTSASWDANTSGAWITHSVSITGDSFTTWAKYSNGSMTFDEVAKNPGYIGLVFSCGNLSILSTNNDVGFLSAQSATIDFGTPHLFPRPFGSWVPGS
jgi:hypothetical protein